jgi:hypothetical protein
LLPCAASFDRIADLIDTLPKVELYVHLVGSSVPTVLELVFDAPGEEGARATRATVDMALRHPPADLIGFGIGGHRGHAALADRRHPGRLPRRDRRRAAQCAARG